MLEIVSVTIEVMVLVEKIVEIELVETSEVSTSVVNKFIVE